MMHANLLTVEAAVEKTFRVRSARLKEFGSAGIIPHAIREGVRYYFIPRNAFSQTGSPYPQYAAVRGFPGPPASPSDKTSRKYYGSLDDQACRKPACTDLCRALFCINNEEGYPLIFTQEYTRSTLRRPRCSRKKN